ncbi:MAG: M20/M25/M40 family metallo-hydrolase [Rheinheimera sp.]|nr:M20/M25/M40 family metallo-hydrolase [Rheinheimera sp.]
MPSMLYRSRKTTLLGRPTFGIVMASLLTILGQSALATELSTDEKALISAIQKRQPAALSLLEQSVRINSGTMNLPGVRAVGALYEKELTALGFACRWVEMPKTMGRAGHLIAERKGSRGKRILLIGHLDTVFEPDSPVVPWSRQGQQVFGQGVADMKGGNLVIIEALRALSAIGALDGAQIQVVFSGDEELVGEPIAVARAELIAAAKRSDVALAFEISVKNSQGQDTGTIGRRAAGGFVLEVAGEQGHSSTIFGKGGYGAVFEAARIIDSFRKQLIEPDLTFNPALILGGTEIEVAQTSGSAAGKDNVIPRTAVIKSDLRYLTAEQRERTHQKMREIVADHLPGTKASIQFDEAYPPMAPTAGNKALLALYSTASEQAGLGAVPALPPGQRGAGDVQFVAPYVDSLDGLGVNGAGSHSPDEVLDIPSIEKSTIRAALVIYRLSKVENK